MSLTGTGDDQRQQRGADPELGLGLGTSTDIDGFTLNPYTSDILAMVEEQRRLQKIGAVAHLSAASGTGPRSAPLPAVSALPSSSGTVAATNGCANSLFGVDEAVAARMQRKQRLAAIETRRVHSRRRCDLVDDLFEKALRRREQAMRRLTADPPADRLVGHNMAQYIPIDLLPPAHRPRYPAKHLVEQQRSPRDMDGGDGMMSGVCGEQSRGPCAVSASSVAQPRTESTLVFLTETDAQGKRTASHAETAPRVATSAVTSTASANHRNAGRRDGGEGAVDTRDHRAPVVGGSSSLALGESNENPQLAELRTHWQELGYDVVFTSAADGPTRRRRMWERAAVTANQTRNGGGDGTASHRTTHTLAVNVDALPASTVLAQRILPAEESRRSEMVRERLIGSHRGASRTRGRWGGNDSDL